MQRYYLALLSKFNHQTYYLDYALQKLVKLGVAVYSDNFNNGLATIMNLYNNLITIVKDFDGNPNLLLKGEDFRSVKEILESNIIRTEATFEYADLNFLLDSLKKPGFQIGIRRYDVKSLKEREFS